MKLSRILFVIIILASIFIINNLVQSIYTLWSKRELVLNMKNEADAEQKRNQELKKKLSMVEKSEFIEQEARNKLFLAKPGDEIVVLSEKDLRATESGKPKPDNRSNWEKWWDLFF